VSAIQELERRAQRIADTSQRVADASQRVADAAVAAEEVVATGRRAKRWIIGALLGLVIVGVIMVVIARKRRAGEAEDSQP
jgi:t-SNARE complex subunit (syntaxin)